MGDIGRVGLTTDPGTGRKRAKWCLQLFTEREAMKDTNKTKLRMLSQIVGIKPAEIADAVGVSRPYLSRLIHEDEFYGSAEFWNALELKLGQLIQNRRSRVFSTPATRLPEEAEAAS